MKVRQIFAKNAHHPVRSSAVEHLFIVDEAGRVFERFSDDPPGQWSEIPLPIRNRQKRVERQKK